MTRGYRGGAPIYGIGLLKATALSKRKSPHRTNTRASTMWKVIIDSAVSSGQDRFSAACEFVKQYEPRSKTLDTSDVCVMFLECFNSVRKNHTKCEYNLLLLANDINTIQSKTDKKAAQEIVTKYEDSGDDEQEQDLTAELSKTKKAEFKRIVRGCLEKTLLTVFDKTSDHYREPITMLVYLFDLECSEEELQSTIEVDRNRKVSEDAAEEDDGDDDDDHEEDEDEDEDEDVDEDDEDGEDIAEESEQEDDDDGATDVSAQEKIEGAGFINDDSEASDDDFVPPRKKRKTQSDDVYKCIQVLQASGANEDVKALANARVLAFLQKMNN